MNKKIIALLGCTCLVTGCTGFGASNMFADSEAGFVMLAGDAEGIRAYNDGLNGILTNAKSSPDVKSSYWQTRDQEVAIQGLRFRRVEK